MRRIFVVIGCGVASVLSINLSAEVSKETKSIPSKFTLSQILTQDGQNFIRTSQNFFLVPKRWETSDYLWAAGMGAAAVEMAQNKRGLQHWSQKKLSLSRNDLESFKILGDRKKVPLSIAILYVSGLLLGSDRERTTGRFLAESSLFSSLLTLSGQIIFSENRPDKGGKLHWFNLNGLGHGVSGHAALAASLAGPINSQYLRVYDPDPILDKFLKYSGKAIVYGLPIMTGLSRIDDNSHFAWNVLLGLGIGFATGEMVSRSLN